MRRGSRPQFIVELQTNRSAPHGDITHLGDIEAVGRGSGRQVTPGWTASSVGLPWLSTVVSTTGRRQIRTM